MRVSEVVCDNIVSRDFGRIDGTDMVIIVCIDAAVVGHYVLFIFSLFALDFDIFRYWFINYQKMRQIESKHNLDF